MNGWTIRKRTNNGRDETAKMWYNEVIEKHKTARTLNTSYAASNQRKVLLSMTSPIVPQTKNCSKCGVEYPATTEYFPARKDAKDGLRADCKACMRVYKAKHYIEHHEEVIQRNKRWRTEHREERRAYQIRYRIENPEKTRASFARYRAEHREERRAYSTRYRAEKPDVVKAAWHRREARKRALPDTLTPQEWERCLEYFGNKCAYCGKTEDFWTQIVPDHWIALKDPRENNPGTTATNVIPACHARKGVPAGTPCCNNSKGNKDPEVWLIEKFGTRKAREILKRIQVYFEWVKEQST